jgi:ribosomal-protein-alanine N-acetyltransferase
MDHVGEIESLYVSPAHRGKKLGEELLKRLMDWFSGNGAASVEVRVAVGNESTHALYRKFGFYPRQTVLTKR